MKEQRRLTSKKTAKVGIKWGKEFELVRMKVEEEEAKGWKFWWGRREQGRGEEERFNGIGILKKGVV